ncbi:hypothetical protein L2E82_04734 [Cichorium intybus]|uniref:Uncharacterized protein n=1 Tax=Cichorium intybus TaxID=13427 RepID=A0ACB9H724_CICIN|nr:hypothetical protein L2E82_04734 [Cichorium intybus]
MDASKEVTTVWPDPKSKVRKEEGKWCEKCRRKHSGSFPTDAPPSGCYNCGKQGNIAREFWAERKCYECAATDHIRLNYPQIKSGAPQDKPRAEQGGKKKETNGRGGPVAS